MFEKLDSSLRWNDDSARFLEIPMLVFHIVNKSNTLFFRDHHDKIDAMKLSLKFVQTTVVVVMTVVILAGFFVGCANSGQFITPGLNDATAKSVVIGMTPAAVEAAIGKPNQRIRFANLYATSWDYRYVDIFGYITEFSVMIADNGRVVETISTRAIANSQ